MPANILEFLQRNNAEMVTLLERNRDVSNFILAVVDHVADYANRRGVRIEDIVVDRPYVEGFDSGEAEYLKARLTHRR